MLMFPINISKGNFMFSQLNTMVLKLMIRWRRFWSELRHYGIEELRSNMETFVSMIEIPQDVELTSVDLGNVLAEWNQIRGTTPQIYILYLHGGGYCLGSIKTHRDLSSRISRAAQAKSLILEYRLAPENCFPTAVDDAVFAYRWMLEQGISPQQIAIVGDSAGGGLAIATMVALRDAGVPLPKAGVCMSPWTDLLGTGESVVTKAQEDPLLCSKDLSWFARRYVGKDGDLRNPLASPLYADLSNLPPLLIQVGDSEVLLDDSRRLAERCEKYGVSCQLQVWPKMVHVWQFFSYFLPEAKQAVDQIGDFLHDAIKVH